VRNRKKPKKLVTDDVKKTSDRDQNISHRIITKQRRGIEQGSIQEVESEAQNLGNEGTNNGKENQEKVSRATEMEKSITYVLKYMEKEHSTST
jgi:hypothetical protein